ncbi:MAG: T9SS type A sorting domain-containing protein [Bacteroidaceae bacterium]|nr:T9SS type A sorting domain-containing protein [Bacteroidaceae bacterium]
MKQFFRFLFTVLLSIGGITAVSAQEGTDLSAWHLDRPVITSVSMLSSEHSDRDEGQHMEYLIDNDMSTFWHADWHQETPQPHTLEVTVEEPLEGLYGFKFGRRNTSGSHTTRMRVEEEVDGAWEELCSFDLENEGPGTTVYSMAFKLHGTRHLRFASLSNSTGNDWGNTWHCAEFQLYPVDVTEQTALTWFMYNYEEVFRDYIDGIQTLNVGTGFGQYNNPEAYDAFTQAGQQAAEIYSTEQVPAPETLMSIVDGLILNLRALIRSEVLYSLQSGYYRILSALKYYADDAEGNRQYVDKAIYGTLDGEAWWGTRDDKDCRQVWLIEQKQDGVRMVNAATDMQLAGVRDGKMTMSEKVDTLLAFDYVGTNADGKDIIYIRFASAPRDEWSGQYLHQQGHGRGTGVEHTLSTWHGTYNMGAEYDSDKGTSEFYVEAVGEEEAQALIEAYAVVRDHDQMVINYRETIAKAQEALDIAIDLRNTYAADTDSPLISTTAQFSSLWSDPFEGSLDDLLDGRGDTFWHSDWHTPASGTHIHSFEVTIDEPAAGVFEAYILRRSTYNSNHVASMSLYGTNDGDLLAEPGDEGWELICSNVSTPWYNGQTGVYSQPFEVGKAYKYWRFYEEATDGESGRNYPGYTHIGDFQLYPAQKVATSQFETMGQVGTDLKNIVDAYPTLNLDELTLEQYNALMDAYEAFMALLVDPSDLRNAIQAQEHTTEIMAIGNDPGFWTDSSTADTLQKVVNEAEQYLAGGSMTSEGIREYVERIEEAANAFNAAPNKVKPGKWYRIRFASEEMFDQYGWSKTYASPMYDWVIAAGYRDEDGVACSYDADKVMEGAKMYFMDEANIGDADVSLFRFIPVTDNTYAVQNKATGLFISRQGEWTETFGQQLSLTPVQIEVSTIGYGQNLLRESRLNGEGWEKFNINASQNSNGAEVASWYDTTPGCNSAMMIEEVEDVEEDFEASLSYMVSGNEMRVRCYPVGLSVEATEVTLYTPVGTFEENGKKFLALAINEENEVPAGQPFFMLPEREDETILTLVARGEIAVEPVQTGGVQGLYYSTVVEAGEVCFDGGKAQTLASATALADNTAYLQYGQTRISEDADYEIALEIDGNPTEHTDAIEQAIRNVSHRDNVYTLSGRSVRRNANLNDLHSLGRGIYILNGTKIIVK